LKVRVFEKAKQLRRVGFSLAITSNGLSALEAISPACLKTVVSKSLDFTIGDAVSLNTEGQELHRRPGVQGNTKLIAWHQLQQALLSLLPDGTVQLGSTLEHLTPAGPDGVILKFAGQPEVQASIVIGCDGNQSRVRQLCLDDGPPEFLNRVCWRGHIETPADWAYHDNCMTNVQLSTGSSFMAVRSDPGHLMWLVTAPWKEEDLPRVASKSYHSYEASTSGDRGKVERCLGVLGDDVLPFIKV
jgi:2-polyprenyl-6-methoxyphenol hydroxylase-like FAD-dependent oxidoreductase